jgi:hypothetical protein
MRICGHAGCLPASVLLPVAQITEAERTRRIEQLLAELNKMPPEKHETVRMPWGGDQALLDVVRIGVDEVLLNPSSHRIRAQLLDDPEWSELSKDPYSRDAQQVIERHVRESRTAEEFDTLTNSLIEGQTDPGVMTRAGSLVNANTRVVALRTLEDPAKRYVRVAVLPASAQPEELALLELRLQMQQDLKVDYTMSNELLFIEELSTKRGMSAAQIARELRISDNPKKGESEVQLRLTVLDLLRMLQKIPDTPLPLTFFDERIALEQLREVQRIYVGLMQESPQQATEYLESFLLSIAVGVSSVHQIRQVDAAFMTDFMMPNLSEDDALGPVAEALATSPDDTTPAARPAGVNVLVGPDEDQEEPAVDIKHLVNLVTQPDKRIDIPGTKMLVDRDDLREAIGDAVKGGIKDKKRVKRDEDQLAAPSDALKTATQQINRAKDALLAVDDDPDFDGGRRKTLEVCYKKLVRACRDVHSTLVKTGIVDK